MALQPVPAREASGIRHDVPADIRQGAVELKALVDRYTAAMGRQWVADELNPQACGMLIRIAREALNLHARHAAFALEIETPDGA